MLRAGAPGVTDPIWIAFGNWLRQAREEASLSLEQVEAQSDEHGQRVTKSYLSRVELGEYLPDLDRLRILGRLYGYTLPDLTSRYEFLKMQAEAEARPDDRRKDYAELIRVAGQHMQKSEHEDALLCYYRALRLAERYHAGSSKQLDALMGVGSCLNILGRWNQARAIAEQLISGGRDEPRILSSGVHLLANSFSGQKHLEIAEALLEGFRRVLNAGPRKPRGRALLSLANVQTELGKPEDACRSAQRALEELRGCEKPVSDGELGQAHHIYAHSLAALGRHGTALEELTIARSFYTRAGADRGVSLAYIQSGDIYFHAQNFPAARRYTTRGVRLARECRAPELLLAGYAQLWGIETRLGNTDMALSHRRMARRLRRRVPATMPFLRGVAHLLDAMEASD